MRAQHLQREASVGAEGGFHPAMRQADFHDGGEERVALERDLGEGFIRAMKPAGDAQGVEEFSDAIDHEGAGVAQHRRVLYPGERWRG